jgi:hypothetical protein
MWRRPVVTILMLVIAAILTLPLAAQQRPVAPGFTGCGKTPSRGQNGFRQRSQVLDSRFEHMRIGSGLGPQNEFFRSLFSPAPAYVAASSPRHGGVKPPLRYAGLKVTATTAAGTSPGTAESQAKPFTQEQVSNMVRDGFGDESGVKLIEQRGIDFAPSEEFYQTLKTAGASEAFLKALRAAKPPEPASAKKPLNQVQVFALLAGGVPGHRVTMLVEERGIDFEPTDDYLQEVRLAGGEDELISALKSARVTMPEHFDPAAISWPAPT